MVTGINLILNFNSLSCEKLYLLKHHLSNPYFFLCIISFRRVGDEQFTNGIPNRRLVFNFLEEIFSTFYKDRSRHHAWKGTKQFFFVKIYNFAIVLWEFRIVLCTVSRLRSKRMFHPNPGEDILNHTAF